MLQMIHAQHKMWLWWVDDASSAWENVAGTEVVLQHIITYGASICCQHTSARTDRVVYGFSSKF